MLIFERIKEELAAGRTARAAVAAGFDRVFLTILDTHVASLIAAAFLFQFGTGPIRGFATTLTFGLLANVFTAVFVSRTIFEAVLSRGRTARLRMETFGTAPSNAGFRLPPVALARAGALGGRDSDGGRRDSGPRRRPARHRLFRRDHRDREIRPAGVRGSRAERDPRRGDRPAVRRGGGQRDADPAAAERGRGGRREPRAGSRPGGCRRFGRRACPPST